MRRSGVRIPLPPHLAWQIPATDSPFHHPKSMKSKTYLIAAAIIAPLVFSLSLAAQTTTKSSSAPPSPTASTSPGKQANRPIPFHGMVCKICKTWADRKENCEPGAKSVDDTEVLRHGQDLLGPCGFNRNPKIGDKVFIFTTARFFIWLPQQRRRMDRGHGFGGEL